jgi:prolyl oligopeptidase PreP (S9A serine peptidase family)
LQSEAGVSLEKVLQIVREAVQHSQVAKSVITPTDEDTKEVTQMLEQQLQTVLNPESQVDQTIPLPENEESLEEYEEIRQLWVEQYRKGEVPLSEDVHTRLEWVEQDVSIITDILTKLISKDENERQQALDEVGFILPVFLMNNLSGLQLITYLKAKVSAAKEVRVELKALQTAKNGFELAELDLSLRGEGGLSGDKQWGLTDLGMESIKNIKMVEAARTEAVRLIKEDSELKDYPLLKAKVKQKAGEFHFE